MPGAVILVNSAGSTTACIRHLRRFHLLTVNANAEIESIDSDIGEEVEVEMPQQIPQVKGLIQAATVNRFRYQFTAVDSQSSYLIC